MRYSDYGWEPSKALVMGLCAVAAILAIMLPVMFMVLHQQEHDVKIQRDLAPVLQACVQNPMRSVADCKSLVKS